MKKVIVTNNRTGENVAILTDYGGDNITGIIANDIIQQLKEQNNILKSIDNHLDKLVRRPIK